MLAEVFRIVGAELGQHHRILSEAESERGTFRTIRFPLRFDGEIERDVTAPPELGADNAEYLGERDG